MRVSIDSSDAAIARTAGVGISGITVRLQRSGSVESSRIAETDAQGTVQFDGLLEGLYSASAERPLTTSELARLNAEDRGASVFAGGAQAVVSPPASRTVDVALVGARRGSLVISELFNYVGLSPTYPHGNYLEVYNNADTTAYLDGIALFNTSTFYHTTWWADCPVYAAIRTDPQRLWANWMLIFPGSGRDHPIRPGEAKVIAMDAINHRAASGMEGMQDLSLADFEEIGTDSDTDNPYAANMLRGFKAGPGALGRGSTFPGDVSYGLARPSAVRQLTTTTIRRVKQNGGVDIQTMEFAGVPAAAVLDVFSVFEAPAQQALLRMAHFEMVVCDPWLSPEFERRVAELYDYFVPRAMRRRSLGRTAAGAEILQRTQTSARDLELAEPLQRSLRK